MASLNKIVNELFNPKKAYKLSIYFILFLYSIPSLIVFFLYKDYYFLKLFLITILGLFGIFIGGNLRILDSFFLKTKVKVNPNKFLNLILVLFIIDILLILYVRPSIPLYSALFEGASQEVLSAQRGYLKNASGLAFLANYFNVLLLTSLVPFCIGLSYYYGLAKRNLIVIVYILFAILFLQKALFISAILPTLVALKMNGKLRVGKIFYYIMFVFLLLYALTNLSVDKNTVLEGSNQNLIHFYSADYETTSSLSFLVWRSVGVPVATAIDSLEAFDQVLSNRPLFGSTSSLVSKLFGLERYNFEQLVHVYQYGDVRYISDEIIGRANSIYLIDSYVNFHLVGVFLISLFVGLIFRGFWKSKEKAWGVLWLLFLFQISSVSFIAIMLSGGYILIVSLMMNIEFIDDRFKI